MITMHLLLIILILILIIIFSIFKYIKFRLISKIIIVIIFLLIIFELTLIFGIIRIFNSNKVENENVKELNIKYISSQQIPSSDISDEGIFLMNIIKNTSNFMPVYSEIEVLENGNRTFESLFNEIENATHHIHVEDYIIREDEIGQKFLNLLITKAQQGIKIRMIIDGTGIKVKRNTLKKLRKSGIDICIVNPIIKSTLMGNINNRDHRKIFIVDGKVAFIGGINIGKEYIGKDPEIGFWRDTNIRIEGEAVKQLQCIFLSSWYLYKGIKIDEREYFPNNNKKYDQLCQTINSLPEGNSSPIEYVYINMINTSKKSVYITTPYLILNEKTYNAIVLAKLRGVDVEIIIPSYSDNNIVHKSTLYYADKLAKKGVKIYKYNKGFIHSKIIIVDENITSIGTANFNNRSLNLDYENCLLIYDGKVVDILNSHFKENIQDSRILDSSDSINTSLISKLIEKFCIIFSPIE